MNKTILELKKKHIILLDTKQLCFSSYYNHPKGCPNAYGKCWNKDGQKCQRMLDSIIDLDKPMYLIYNEFDVESWSKVMKRKHPNWTERQCRCLLYWQGRTRAKLRQKTGLAKVMFGLSLTVLTRPEYYGVNIYATFLNATGIILDPVSDVKICRHVVILGNLKRRM